MREQLVLLFIQVLAVAAVNANIGPIRLHFPFYIHEKDNFSSDNLEKGDVSGKFWLAMNYTYAVVNGNSTNISANKGYFDLRLTRFDVREGPPDDIFTSDLDRVWAKDKGWPVDLIMSFPDLGTYNAISSRNSVNKLNDRSLFS